MPYLSELDLYFHSVVSSRQRATNHLLSCSSSSTAFLDFSQEQKKKRKGIVLPAFECCIKSRNSCFLGHSSLAGVVLQLPCKKEEKIRAIVSTALICHCYFSCLLALLRVFSFAFSIVCVPECAVLHKLRESLRLLVTTELLSLVFLFSFCTLRATSFFFVFL